MPHAAPLQERMRAPAEYRRKAAEFDELARKSANEEMKALYVELAREYRDIAANVERLERK
jgi:hypothetical protein